jgi:hypothetical protein
LGGESPFVKIAVVRSEEFTVLLAVLVEQRKNAGRPVEPVQSARDLRDVLSALHTVGHCIVPCGAIDALKRALLQYGTEEP